MISRIRITLFALLFLFTIGCRNSSSGGGVADLTADALTGSWLVSLEVTQLEGTNCDPGNPVGSVESSLVTIAVVGNQVILTPDDGSPITLELRGSRVQGVETFDQPNGPSSSSTIDFGIANGVLTGSITEEESLAGPMGPVMVCRTVRSISGVRQSIPQANFAGSWIVTTQELTNTCFGNLDPVVSLAEISQVGSIVTVDDVDGALTGSVVGNTVTLTRNDQVTSITLSMVPGGLAFSGGGTFRYPYLANLCDRTVVITGERFTPRNSTASAWLDFENGLVDATGNGFNGNPVNTFSIASGVSSSGTQSGSFDGLDSRVELQNSAALNVSTAPYTVSVWVNPAEVTGSHVIWQKAPDDGSITTHCPSLLLFQGNLYLDVYFIGNTGGSVTLPQNQWSNVVVTYDGGTTYSVFVDGNLVASNSGLIGGNEGQNVEGPWVFTLGEGLTSFSTDDFVGLIDDFQFWQRALTAGEVSSLANFGPTGI